MKFTEDAVLLKVVVDVHDFFENSFRVAFDTGCGPHDFSFCCFIELQSICALVFFVLGDCCLSYVENCGDVLLRETKVNERTCELFSNRGKDVPHFHFLR